LSQCSQGTTKLRQAFSGRRCSQTCRMTATVSCTLSGNCYVTLKSPKSRVFVCHVLHFVCFYVSRPRFRVLFWCHVRDFACFFCVVSLISRSFDNGKPKRARSLEGGVHRRARMTATVSCTLSGNCSITLMSPKSRVFLCHVLHFVCFCVSRPRFCLFCFRRVRDLAWFR
jgi:hypothetical protein